MSAGDIWVGIDLGTSGCRAIAIDSQGDVIARQSSPYSPSLAHTTQDPETLWQHVKCCLRALIARVSEFTLRAIAVDATSGSVLLANPAGQALSPILLYHDTRAVTQARQIAGLAPIQSAAQGLGSGLAKFLWLQHQYSGSESLRLLHQADWINVKLGTRVGISDCNNALKTGYDPVHNQWPDWLDSVLSRSCLPAVVAPGSKIGIMSASLASSLGLRHQPDIVAGTTDSIAAFLATGASQVGDAVTSLGSTLVLKLVTDKPVFSPPHGIYSHRLGSLWLAGGASNSGGAVLKQFFNAKQLAQLSTQIDLQQSAPEYYPLLQPGERFPICDPALPARLEPRPDDNRLFLHGLLKSMARIEQQGYALLSELSGCPLRTVITTGAGSVNPVWQTIRQHLLAVPVYRAEHHDAAYGSAQLARDGLKHYTR